ncbi:MAG: hypothetical protein HY231_11900 [Acidobacteria bacterium]|nr:hypothetical protein [Acidobacteriota bacterium]
MRVSRKFILKKAVPVVVVAACLALSCHFFSTRVQGIPMFARRYGVPCSTCHTSPPRLNETGYQFRAAGFRMPEEIGKNSDRKNRLTDHLGFRLQPRYDARRSATATAVATVQQVKLFAAEGYLWYGPVSKYFSSNLKITMWPEASNETELKERLEGTIRFTYGKNTHFIDLRAGVPHPYEGFGGSETYVASDTRPFIQELRTAHFNQDTFFTPLGFHQQGVSLGYHYKRTTISGQLLGGLRLKADAAGHLEPFGRKEPFSKALGASRKGGPDFQLYVNQTLAHEGGNLSLYYYKGRSYLPRLDLATSSCAPLATCASADASTTTWPVRLAHRLPLAASVFPALATTSAASDPPIDLASLPFFKNDFYRLGFYAGYPVKRARLLYGIQRGRDTIGAGGQFTSLGQFAEAMIMAINDISAVGLRYDWFDPARNLNHNDMKGVTAYVNLWLHHELRITPEYQHLVFQQGSRQPNRREDRFQLRLYWVK